MKLSRSIYAAILAVVIFAACSDEDSSVIGPEADEAFERYVAIGTSLSMGVMSDGVLYSSQMQSWTALLAHAAFASFRQPLIQAPGCFSPFIAPLQLGRRLSGAPAPGTIQADTVCALFPDVVLPTRDVGIDGADTYDALRVTPETTLVEAGSTVKRRRQYRIVLPAGRSQVTAMMMQNPTLVSVELGANEVLQTTSGLVVTATAYRTPRSLMLNSGWQPVYAMVLDSVRKTGAKALLVSVPNVTSIVSFRTGDEIWQNRAEFANFGVVVNANCQSNTNLIFVPVKVGTAVATARATGTAFNFSCADVPGTQDNVLTPGDVTTITGVVNGMNAYISSQASANGWAYLDLAPVLQKGMDNRGPYRISRHFGCVNPYGQFVSLDGVHPNVQGYQEMANAAAVALNDRYGFSIPQNPQAIRTQAQLCPDQP